MREAADSTSSPATPPSTGRGPGAPLRLLLADDQALVRGALAALLDTEPDLIVVAQAASGDEVADAVEAHDVDVALLDIEMPRMDGFEVATLVRHDERLGNLPIIMITSRTGEKHRERALGIGVNQYLGKPYQETELLEAIQSLVGQHE